MHATLIHNPTAGSEQPAAESLVAWLRDTGFDVRYASSKRKEFVAALEDPGDLVVVGGGDGTVTKVATRLVGRDIPLAILPLGTSNNIATTLGVHGTPEEIIRALPTAERRWLDTGIANAPWGLSRFVESTGVGLFAAILEHAERNAERREDGESNEEKLALGVLGTQRVLAGHAARHYRVEADGIDLSGDYVFVAAMNIKRIGSTLELAPDADSGDGKLDLVMLREEDRGTLASFLDQLLHDAPARFPMAPRRVSVVRIGWEPEVGHLDDERWPAPRDAAHGRDQDRSLVEITIAVPPVSVVVGTATST